ncbi:LysM peptidoglycan-binding domain-containing protein [Chryseobacterium jejuense]|uniref:LysM peptidoglycan-binding domain-containing protein n=1 Tax=Chryseobacterium jejuense TaxID=445960 RepID=UPI001AE7BE9F|nr:LysM domain-containing protein [Chryseobacterium jejuense]MBP2619644.1 hypothetical protein [Chryseobacterium jejuense]
MKFTQYKIHKGDTLESIAGKYEISVENLKSFHNSHCGFASMIISDKLPIQLEYLVINPIAYKEAINKMDNPEELNFNQSVRYRCEQLNISRVNNETITLSASTYSEFLVQKMDHTDVFNVTLTDFNFTVDPVIYEKGFLFAQKLEKLRFPITFNISETGFMNKIFNHDEIEKKWIKFRDFGLTNDEVYKQLSSQAPKQAEDIIVTGNKEFMEKKSLSKTMDKNLFFHIFFRAYQGGNLKDYELSQFSQLFPNIDLKTDVVKSIVTEDERFATYRLVGTLNRKGLSEEGLKEMYDKIYKPAINYSYTEFDFVYRITYTIDKSFNFVTDAKASIAEKVKNNFEVITEYKIKKVEL